MDYPDPDPSDKTTHVSNHTYTVVRTMLSAVIFGAIGATLGRWIAKREGNDPSNRMLKSVMTLGMGGFWATLAAYSSIKASGREGSPDVTPRQSDAEIVRGFEQPQQTDVEGRMSPTLGVHTDAAHYQGVMQEKAPELLAQK